MKRTFRYNSVMVGMHYVSGSAIQKLKALQAYSGLLSIGLVSRIGHRHRICPSCRFCHRIQYMPVVLLTLVKGSERDDSALCAVIGLALRPLTGQNHPFPTLSLVRNTCLPFVTGSLHANWK